MRPGHVALVAATMLLAASATALAIPTGDDGITFPTLAGPVPGPPSARPKALPCEGHNYANDNYVDTISMGGPLVAVRWIPAASVIATRMEVFTGEHVGSAAVAIWDSDGAMPGRPVAALGWSNPFAVATTNAWYGADLNVAVPVTAGTTYWVVWDPEGGEQANVTDDPADVQQFYYGSFSGTVSGGVPWELGPFTGSDHRWKFKIFCIPAGCPDADADAICDDVDLCDGTVVPEIVPLDHLGVNRWALVDDDDIFDTTPPNGVGPKVEFTLEDTRGCSCEQIIEALGIGEGHEKFGCSTGVMRHWTAIVSSP